MERFDRELKDRQELEKKSLAHINKDYATKKILQYSKPCSAKTLSYISSMLIGGVAPVVGYLIIKLMAGLAIAQFFDRNGLEEIYPYICIMFGLAFLLFFFKGFQQVGFAFVHNYLGRTMRMNIYEAVLRKSMSWHDEKANSSGVIGNMLNAEVNSLTTVAIDTMAAQIEGFGGILVGLAFSLAFSWPISLAILCIIPLMMISSKVGNRVKHK